MNGIGSVTAEHAYHDQITWGKIPCQEGRWEKMREKNKGLYFII